MDYRKIAKHLNREWKVLTVEATKRGFQLSVAALSDTFAEQDAHFDPMRFKRDVYQP